MSIHLNVWMSKIMCTPLKLGIHNSCQLSNPVLGGQGGGGLSLRSNFQKKRGGGGLERISIFRGGLLGKRRSDFFQGELKLLHKK